MTAKNPAGILAGFFWFLVGKLGLICTVGGFRSYFLGGAAGQGDPSGRPQYFLQGIFVAGGYGFCLFLVLRGGCFHGPYVCGQRPVAARRLADVRQCPRDVLDFLRPWWPQPVFSGTEWGTKMKNRMALPAALAAIALMVSACSSAAGESESGGSTSSPSASVAAAAPASAAPAAEPAAAKSSFADNVLTTDDLKITITEHRVIPVGEPGNEYGEKPVIAFWYQITNLSGENVSPMNWIYSISAFQDNNPNSVNQIEIGSLPDSRFLDTQTETIKKGGTVENAVAYELDDLTTPVDLVASDDLGFTEIGKLSFDLQ